MTPDQREKVHGKEFRTEAEHNPKHQTHPDMRCHLICAHLGQISAKDPIVEAIEDEEQAAVHPGVGLGTEQEVESHHRHHDDDVAYNPQATADLVDQ